MTEIRHECRQDGDVLVAQDGVAAVAVRLKDRAISNKISEVCATLNVWESAVKLRHP